MQNQPPQQPYYQPQTQYSQPGQPDVAPQQPPKKRKSRTWLWIVLAVFAGMVVGYSIHVPATPTTAPTVTTTPVQTVAQATTAPTQAPTPVPTHALKWVTTHTFTGNGTKKTGFFTVPDNWKLVWKCNPSSSYFGQYNVIVSVTGADGSPVDPVAVNTMCQTGNTGDSTEEHQGGQIYLDVTSEASWTIQVQELK